jgi:hypothetical protein
MLRSLTCVLVPALALGCALAPDLPGTPPGTEATPELPAFASLRFGPPSLDAVEALGHVPPLVAPPAGEDPAPSLAPRLPHAQSGDVGTHAAYSLDTLMGQPETRFTVQGLPFLRALTGFQEAVLPGYTGPFVKLRSNVIQPFVTAWATDATLVRANVSPEELKGSELPPTFVCGPHYGPPWDLVYVSASRQAALRFLVRDHRILVLRLEWQRPGSDMPTPNVPPPDVPAFAWPPVNREAAIQKLVAALRTPGAVGAEEQTRRNHFHGTPHAEPSHYADQAPGLEPGPIYEVPADTAWEAALLYVLGRWVWVLHAPATATASPTPSPAGFRVLCTTAPSEPRLVTQGAPYGMVDAERGDVIRFARPVRRIERFPQR